MSGLFIKVPAQDWEGSPLTQRGPDCVPPIFVWYQLIEMITVWVPCDHCGCNLHKKDFFLKIFCN